MKATRMLLLVSPIVWLLAACGPQESAEYKTLKSENDSLKLAKAQMEREMNNYLEAVNTIQENIETMKRLEKTITIQPVSETMDNDAISKLNGDISYLNDLLQSNRDELDRLRKKLQGSGLKIAEMEKTITALSARLDAETQRVAALEAELSRKNELIGQLTDTVAIQGAHLEELRSSNETQASTIKQQEADLATAWYVFGTRKELKEQGIITSSGFSQKVLDGDFNKDYFVKIDARKTKSIPLYSSRAKLLTTHPKSSYTLEKENGNYVLVIVDSSSFWSISNYLVVEVD